MSYFIGEYIGVFGVGVNAVISSHILGFLCLYLKIGQLKNRKYGRERCGRCASVTRTLASPRQELSLCIQGVCSSGELTGI